MSHSEQIAFFKACVAANASALHNARVLEIGSYDVNGSVRGTFKDAREYIGVDLVPGPGVDVVGFGHEVQLGNDTFDVVVSGECFEHDQYWTRTFESMVRHARPGGLVIVTCASRGRVEHGTARSGATQSPGTEHIGSTYYCNIDQTSFERVAAQHGFATHQSWYLSFAADLYFCGIKAGARSDFKMPDPHRVSAISNLMPWRERIVRYPLHLTSHLPISEQAFQSFAIPYWRTTVKLRNLPQRTASRLATRLGK